MAALLAARNITAEQVLIHAGFSFTLPDTPLQQAFNHVIVYLPNFNRFVDPTDPMSTFSSLSAGLAGKPVVRVSTTGAAFARLARTPAGSPEENVVRINTRLTISPEFTMRSESVVEGTGEFAHSLRQTAAAAEAPGANVVADKLVKSSGLSGPATLEAPSSLDGREPYRVKTAWIGEKPFQLLERGLHPPSGLKPLIQR